MIFKKNLSFDERKNESEKILIKYPDRIPIIVEKNLKSKNCPDIDKNKYLVPIDLTVGQFMYVIRKRIKLKSEDSLFLFINGSIPSTSQLLNHIYNEYKDPDGFLYIVYSKENVFG